jgi:aryl-alcohol dehydrogenase-like predicted oxidoreductase
MKYKLFGKSGLRVSEICLGTMTFGTEWHFGTDYENAKAVFEAYSSAGGNFLDTANRYTEGNSEKWLGEFIASNRDHYVLATKYSLHDQLGDLNFAGNHRKNLYRSVKESLKRLKTDYIDILWLHAWDFTTPIEEIMNSLNDLVRNGTVHHIAVSDTPAWIVAAANTFARERNLAQFCALQVEYSLTQRTPERDFFPMAEHFGIAVTPWGPLAGGALTGKYLNQINEGKRLKPDSVRLNERNSEIAKTVVAIAEKNGQKPAQVALRWCMNKNNQTFPIVGAKTAKQITESLQSCDVVLSTEDMHVLNEISKIELGFPHDFLSSDSVKTVLFAGEKNQLIL